MATTKNDEQVGARSVTGKRSYGLGWLPWVLAFLLLALAAIVVLIVANVNDENDEPGVDVTDDEVTNETAPSVDSPLVITA